MIKSVKTKMTQQTRKRKQISLDVKYTVIQHHNDDHKRVQDQIPNKNCQKAN